MDIQSVKELASGLTIAIGSIGPGLGIGLIGSHAMDAIGRNPEATSKIQSAMILSIAFCEAIAIYSLVLALIIRFV